MASESDIYDPTTDLPIETGTGASAKEVPAQVGDKWAKVKDTSAGEFRTIIYRDGAGSGPRRVIIEQDRDGGFHVDQTNEDWPNHTNWLTDEGARDEDRARDPVQFEVALGAAIDYMQASGARSKTSPKPYDPMIEFDDPLVEKELEAAGIEPEDLVLEDEPGHDVAPPESVAGWKLTTEEEDFISWSGDGGRHPAGFIADETTATVTALSHGGRWENRWTTRVKYKGPGRDGKEHSTTSTIASYTLTFSTGDRGYAKNRARAIEAAVEWMEEHPSQDRSDDDPEAGEASSGSSQTIEFGRLDAANDWRDENAEFLCPDDRRTTMTVTLRSDAPDEIVEDARTKALASREGERKTYGQTQLSEDEKAYFKRTYDSWEWQKYGFEAMAAKAALQAEGVSDWLNYYEPGEGVDGSLANMERGKAVQAMTGAPTALSGGYDDSDPDISKQANMAARAIGGSCIHARTWCEEGDDVACAYLVTDCGWTEEDVAALAEQVEAFEEEMDELLTDDGGRVEPGQPVEAPAVPKTGEIPGFAKGTLKRAWTGYRAAVAEAAEYRAEAEEFEASRSEAERYAQIVNEVRGVFGQKPMSFERLSELNEVSPVELPDAPTNEENTSGFRAALEWSQRTMGGFVGDTPYDPVEEVGGAATGTSDLEKAKALHATRSGKAQEIDESIQAREQVVDFEEWAEAPNMKDFVGVDDLESVLGIVD